MKKVYLNCFYELVAASVGYIVFLGMREYIFTESDYSFLVVVVIVAFYKIIKLETRLDTIQEIKELESEMERLRK